MEKDKGTMLREECNLKKFVKLMLNKVLPFFRIAFLLFLSVGWNHPNLDKISLSDRQKLNVFFDYLIHNSVVGYSLCGDKPVSIETFPTLSRIPTKNAVIIFAKYQGYSILRSGWDLWTRYSYLFASQKFVLRFVPEYSTLVFINKDAAKKVIANNLDLFQKYSSLIMTSEEFLEEICNPKNKEYAVGNNPILLGILLGYGRNNAIAFTKKSFIQKLEAFKLYPSDDHLNEFINPGFMIINNGTNQSENENIRKSFRKTKKILQSKFREGNSLESFIELFTKRGDQQS